MEKGGRRDRGRRDDWSEEKLRRHKGQKGRRRDGEKKRWREKEGERDRGGMRNGWKESGKEREREARGSDGWMTGRAYRIPHTTGIVPFLMNVVNVVVVGGGWGCRRGCGFLRELWHLLLGLCAS